MKKLLIIICIGTVVWLTGPKPAQPATLEVRPPGGMGTLGNGDIYTCIQDAIDDANDGDELIIHDGTYTETLTITNKGLTLTGEDESTVIVEANGTGPVDGDNVFTINADGKDITIQNMTIRNGDYGIRSSNGNINVLHCTFYHNGWDGAGLPDPETAPLEDFVYFWNNSGHVTDGGAMRIENSAGSEIAYCSVYDNDRGIRFQNGDNGNIHNNVSHDNIESGIYLAASSYSGATGCTNTDVNDNECYGNMNNGILSIGGHTNTIRNNDVYDNWTSGIAADYPSEITIQGNTINNNNVYGFTGEGTQGENHGGIFMSGSTDVASRTFTAEILSNTISNNNSGTGTDAEGIRITSSVYSDGIDIEDNTFINHDIDILLLSQAATTTVNQNKFDASGIGVQNDDTSATLDAEYNWWGDAAGPYNATTNPDALGDEVSDYVDYEPWYATESMLGQVIVKIGDTEDVRAVSETIQDGVYAAHDGDTVEVAAGTYVEDGQIVIDKNLTIKGVGSSKPVVKTNQDTSNAGEARGWWLVSDGVTLDLENLVLDGSGHLIWQGIRSRGQGTIESVDFKNILYNESGPDYSGLAMAVFGAAPVDVNGCTFQNIGRISVLYYGSGVAGSVFSNNTYTGKGPGDWLDYGVELGAGAVVEVKQNTITDCNGIASSDGSTSAGILATTYYGAGTEGIITGNTLTTNSAGMAFGYGDADTTVVTARCNLISGNFEYGIQAEPNCSVDAEYNWWGSASGPSGQGGGSGDAVSEYVDFFPWLLSTDCGDFTQQVADFVVDDDWVDKELWETVTVDSTAYYIGLNAFDTIQGAVDAASDGNSISVADGNYVENLVIGKSVNIIGAGGETSVIESATGLKLISINAADTEVELAGFTLRHTGTDNWSSSYVMLIENGAYAYIHDNVIDDFKKRGIYVMGSGSSADIVANTIIGEGEGSGLQNGIVVWNSGGGFANIVNNEVSGGYYTGERWTATGIMALDTYDKAVLIAGNYVHDNQVGIAAGNYCEYTPGSYSADVTVRANRVEYNTYGVDIFNDIRGALVQGNYISASTEYAIGVSDYNDTMAPCEQPTDTIIQFNNIADNNLGMWVIDRVGPVDAQYNFWGDVSGPNDPCGADETDGVTCYDVETMKNADGAGDGVTENVDYCPWLLAPVVSSDGLLPLGDLNGDGCVNFRDVAIWAEHWLEGCE